MSRKLPEPPDMELFLPAMARVDLHMAQRRLKSYPRWVQQLHELDRWFAGIASPDLFGVAGVAGGNGLAVQEKVMILKESHPGYTYFRSSVEKVEAILEVLSPAERDVVRLWHFEKIDEYDICGLLGISRRTLFRRKKEAERMVAWLWRFETEEIRQRAEGITSEKVRKMILAVSP